jgi:hypothetical protein
MKTQAVLEEGPGFQEVSVRPEIALIAGVIFDDRENYRRPQRAIDYRTAL